VGSSGKVSSQIAFGAGVEKRSADSDCFGIW
jgi:hypothetical protein